MSNDLPGDCWEVILKAIGEEDYSSLDSLSLVSKSLFDFTNKFRRSLVITQRTVPYLHRLLNRFSEIKKIWLCDLQKNLDSALLQISHAKLDIESVCILGEPSSPRFPNLKNSGMKMMINIKELHCSGVGGLRNIDLVLIGSCFKDLEILDISDPYPHHGRLVTDLGIIGLSSNSKKLLKINFSNHRLITEASIVSLSRNCLLLKEVKFNGCDVTESKCISFLVRNSRNLEALKTRLWPTRDFHHTALLFAPCLADLDLSQHMNLTDEKLALIANAKLHLNKFSAAYCQRITFDGILNFLSQYHGLIHLDLEGLEWISDDMLVKFLQFLHRLNYLKLSYCTKLTVKSFFNIIKACVSIKCLIMERTRFGEEYCSKEPCFKSGMKSLYLPRNKKLCDDCLKKITLWCPLLESLQISQCVNVTQDGVIHVLRSFQKLRVLDINGCDGIRRFCGLDFDVPSLESLRARGTVINDDDLDMISNRCRGLVHIDLEGCPNVSSRGWNKIVVRCRRLRDISVNTFNGHPREIVKKMVKEDLAEEVWRLQASLCEQTKITKFSQQEYERLQNEKVMCKVCFENEISLVLLPCRHRVLCRNCSDRCEKCPICRITIEERLPVYDV